MIYIERCNDCRRLIKVWEIERYEVSLLMEEVNTWKKVCWVCRCKKSTKDHEDFVAYEGCGCL